MKILLTGSEGFIGSHLAIELMHKKHCVIGYDLKNGDDILDKRKLEYLFETENFDLVLHLAALTGARRGELYPQEYFNVNVLGTKNIIDLCEKFNVPKYIHFSSSSAKQPDSIYGMSKYNGELLTSRSKIKEVAIIRPFTVIGYNGRRDQVIYKWFNTIKAGKKIEVHGYKTNRNFTYVGDIVKFIKRLLETKIEPSPMLFELCNPNKINLEELVNIFENHFGKYVDKVDVGLSEYEMFENTGRWDSPYPATNAVKIIKSILHEES